MLETQIDPARLRGLHGVLLLLSFNPLSAFQWFAILASVGH